MSTFGIILTIAFALYVLSVTIFIVLDNRSPQSTLAWLLLLYAFPFVGLMVYIFFGRDWKAFSKQGDQLRREIGDEMGEVLKPLLDRQDEYVEKIATDSQNRLRSGSCSWCGTMPTRWSLATTKSTFCRTQPKNTLVYWRTWPRLSTLFTWNTISGPTMPLRNR